MPRYAVIDSWPPGPIHMWARVGGGSAERAEGRSAGAARAGKRARRSGAQPGLDEVGKVLSLGLVPLGSVLVKQAEEQVNRWHACRFGLALDLY